MRRFFIEKIGEPLILTGAEHKHLAYVLRAKKGETVALCTGDGTDSVCEIVAVEADRTRLRLIERTQNVAEPRVSFTAFTAVIKGERTDLAFQKLTELGAREIYPVISKFVQSKKESVKIERLFRICAEAAKQCGRATVPYVRAPIDFKEIPALLSSFDLVLFPYENAKTPDIKTFLKAETASKRIDTAAVIIGSEGGFCADEAELLIKAGVTPVTMGKRILRAETANITAAALLMYELGELS